VSAWDTYSPHAFHDSRLGIPRIGAGLGGLEWTDVAEVLTRAADESAVELVVVTFPAAR
jgi:O-acetyl-ADP-ribose deacetylase (regulator of RNase III)